MFSFERYFRNIQTQLTCHFSTVLQIVSCRVHRNTILNCALFYLFQIFSEMSKFKLAKKYFLEIVLGEALEAPVTCLPL